VNAALLSTPIARSLSAALVGALMVLAHVAGPGAQSRSRTQSVDVPLRMTIEDYRLPNGLNVVLSRDPSVPVVAVNLWYHVGSANEQKGRTGFAHLFEHMMFQGSANVGDDEHFRLIQEAGGTLNGSTSTDRTNYYQAVPANFLEQVLWQEADRMGFLLPGMTEQKLDNQRSVVQNERRQRIENAPYGLASETIAAAMYPAGHPYSWPVIGSMADLNAASMDDVRSFFRTYYAPNNASLAIVGDFDPDQARRWVEKYFGGIPAGTPIERPRPGPVHLDSERRPVLEDRVQLPRLYSVWISPGLFAPLDAELDVLGYILAGDRNSRLTQRLVNRERIAQAVSASQSSRPLGGQFAVIVQARPGIELERVRTRIDEEIARLLKEPPTDREIQQAKNNLEAAFLQDLETVLGRADRLNGYAVYAGDPAYVPTDVGRYAKVTAAGVQQAIRQYLHDRRVLLSVVPTGQQTLAVR
jgi:zinc protease